MAITSKSTLRDVLADPRAVAVIEEYVPGVVGKRLTCSVRSSA